MARRVLFMGLLAGWLAAAAIGRAQEAPAAVTLVPPGEPGEPLVVEGRILAPGGPEAGADLYVYQTDARGYYSPGGSDERNPRLKARLRTDERGAFRFRTIRPGPYPRSGPPAHIHFEVTPASGATQRYELVFEGDARLSASIRDDARTRGFYAICAPAADSAGTLHCRGVEFRLR